MDQLTVELPAKTGRDELVTLLRAISNGDHDAFSVLYQRTAPKLYGICVRLLGNESDAQDVLQEAYVTLWRNARQFDPVRASPITFLAILARNKAIDRLRRRARPTEELGEAEAIEDRSPSAFSVIAQEQDAERLKRCLAQLDERAAALIRSAFLEGATYPELAAREGAPLGSVKSWIRRGLQRLRGCLEQ